ncbi:hypothetical protein CE91St45_15830 [Oscillospiraceae bacterium]|nr:hypothetical protein CE91St45_15830 [Oscillospiraceae bacterium]
MSGPDRLTSSVPMSRPARKQSPSAQVDKLREENKEDRMETRPSDAGRIGCRGGSPRAVLCCCKILSQSAAVKLIATILSFLPQERICDFAKFYASPARLFPEFIGAAHRVVKAGDQRLVEAAAFERREPLKGRPLG